MPALELTAGGQPRCRTDSDVPQLDRVVARSRQEYVQSLRIARGVSVLIILDGVDVSLMPVGCGVDRHLPLGIKQSDLLVCRCKNSDVRVYVLVMHSEIRDRVRVGSFERRYPLEHPALLQSLHVICIFVRVL